MQAVNFTMDDQLTINDLPVECVDEILKWITDRVDRIYARFVCKLWCALIDQDCTAEHYIIDRWGRYNQGGKTNFIEMYSPFLMSRRKKTTFSFDYVDFRGCEQFWRTKGKDIIELEFGRECANMALEEIVEHCSVLKSLTIKFYHDNKEHKDRDRSDEFIFSLENCVANGNKNSSVRFLYLDADYFDYTDIVNVTALVSQVFLGVQKVFFDKFPFSNVDDSSDWPSSVNSISTAFKDLKFVITISNLKRSFIFDPSCDVPLRMTKLSIKKMRNTDDVLTYLLHCPFDHNHITKLIIDFNHWSGDYKLDDLQEIITRCPSLKSIYLSVKRYKFDAMTNLLSKNNIEELLLFHMVEDMFLINESFLQSFENLKSLFIFINLAFSDFVKLLRKLPYLENLRVGGSGTIDVDPVEETISNGRLLELHMPNSFLLQTIVKYEFSNLRRLELKNVTYIKKGKLGSYSRNYHFYLKRLNCPKLENLYLDFITTKWKKKQDKFTQWMINVLALFPTLTEFIFSPITDINIHKGQSAELAMETSDKILKTILPNHRRLKKIGAEFDPHILITLSPSLIKHEHIYGQSVLNIL